MPRFRLNRRWIVVAAVIVALGLMLVLMIQAEK